MDGAGDDRLARPRLAADQHRRVGGGDLADAREDGLHGRTATLELAQPVAVRRARAGRTARPALREDLVDEEQELVVIERLGDIVGGAHSHRLDRRPHRRVARHDEHRHAGGARDEIGSRRPRQPQVGEHEITAERAGPHRLLDRAGLDGLVAAPHEQAPELLAEHRFVLDDEDGGHQGLSSSRGRLSVTVVPAPGSLRTSSVPS